MRAQSIKFIIKFNFLIRFFNSYFSFSIMKKDLLLVLTVESVVLGVVLGFVIRPLNPSNDAISLIGFPGEIFMQIVEMMILPLIISSVISALAQTRAVVAGRMGLLTVAYYMTTTFLSTFTGILLVSCIHPGNPQLIHEFGEGTLDDTALSPMDTFLDQIRNMFPENIVQATFQQVQTNYVPVKPPRLPQKLTAQSLPALNGSGSSLRWQFLLSGLNITTTTPKPQMKPILEYTNEVNVLGLIVFCTGFGVILSVLGEQARLMINFFIVLDAVIMRWISALMWCYPIGILSLVCKNIVDIDNLTEAAQVENWEIRKKMPIFLLNILFMNLKALAMYVVTVICGLMIHSLLTLPLLYYLITRQSPFEFMTGMLQAIATAFGTASSGATLPVTFRALEQNLRIDRRVTRFVLPLGATITMDGTALYEAVAVIFIAQLHNIKLTGWELLTISITTTVASIGSGSVPAGLDTILIVLTTVGLPAKDLSLLLTVDWLLDRIRTSVNVLVILPFFGDGFGCGIISHLTKTRLIESDNVELIRQLKTDIEMLNAPDANQQATAQCSQYLHPNPSPNLRVSDHSSPSADHSHPSNLQHHHNLQSKLHHQHFRQPLKSAAVSAVARRLPPSVRPLLMHHASPASPSNRPTFNSSSKMPPTPSVFTFPPNSPPSHFSAPPSAVVLGAVKGPPKRKISGHSLATMPDERRSLLEGSMEFTV